ncbi:3-ketoacyl-CoA thiolase, mitochondrial-like isoform X1 [Spodoptera litura]|uniref:3-ketoacyl-CoA thiolase, mitochondrial-like isoform X1 n=1 Tax=Spodoptera litura TaxID=69820 RepID=A0A9J7IH14_SPOLT|nr:3-ketoacyl-CoA thiolase, mitochondrial-like isoform X1 [Spodoptera litura]
MAVVLKSGLYIVAAKRTPFAKMGREFKDIHPSEQFAIAAREAFKTCHLSPDLIDTVNVGQVYTISGSSDGILTPRHSGLRSGIPYDRPTLGVNRLCGSGFEAIINSARDILYGPAQISLAGGTENMSAIPFLVRGFRFGTQLGKPMDFEDYLKAGSVDSYCNLSMAQTSENLADMYKLKRDQVDEYAMKSQMKWKAGFDDGAFEAEIVPVTVVINGKQVVVDKDQHPRPNTTMEALSKLPALFREGGVGTVGNSTGVNDGAGVLIVASEEAIKQQNLTPLVRLVAWSHAGVEPRIMGLGPVPAIKQLLKATGFTMDDIDMIELNEQFAAQALANVIEMDLDQTKLNMNGGAIAVGHPAAASGARIAAHLAHELRRKGLKRGIGATCIGGGQGIAVLLETV